jgi:hypothetical protein
MLENIKKLLEVCKDVMMLCLNDRTLNIFRIIPTYRVNTNLMFKFDLYKFIDN